MFFIFGWNHAKVTEYGPVQEEKCPRCHNTDNWHLKQIDKYFTLFFIPVFRQDGESFYYCPICNHGVKPDREDFESYKAIAQANADYFQDKITEVDRDIRFNAIHKAIRERKGKEHLKSIEESKKWKAVVAEKSSEELQHILDKQREEYTPAFIIAATEELERRKTNN